SLATYGTAGYATFHKLARAYMPRRQLRAQTYPHRHTLGGGPRMTMRYVEALSRRGFEESGTARLIVLTRTPQYKRGSRVPGPGAGDPRRSPRGDDLEHLLAVGIELLLPHAADAAELLQRRRPMLGQRTQGRIAEHDVRRHSLFACLPRPPLAQALEETAVALAEGVGGARLACDRGTRLTADRILAPQPGRLRSMPLSSSNEEGRCSASARRVASPNTMYAGTPCSRACPARHSRRLSKRPRSPSPRVSAALVLRAIAGRDLRPITSWRSSTGVSPRST